MKRIAIIIVLMYGSILIALTCPVLLACFYTELDSTTLLGVFQGWLYWLFLIVMLLCQLGLLLIPLRMENKRPITKRTIYLPIIITGFLIGCVLLGIICAISEFLAKSLPFKEAWQGWTAIGICILVWIAWALIFCRVTQVEDAKDIISSQCKKLIKWSVVSLLVAVPAHIVARHRNYCCAGFYTFIGIVFGIAVMLAAFGPGIFFLYAARFKKPRSESSVI